MQRQRSVIRRVRERTARPRGPSLLNQSKPTRTARRARTLDTLERLPLNPRPLALLMQADGSDPEALISVFGQCPVLTARVVGVANSAGSTAIHKMDSVERCVRHLGARQARTVALTLAMQLIAKDVEVDPEALGALWASATTKAVAAAMTAEVTQPDQIDSAYCSGLVQDIALPVLLALDPAFFSETLARNNGKRAWIELEQEHFGIDHAELGGLLLQKWNAPDAIADQVRWHHDKLANNDTAWIAEMPARVAGLLPHIEEQPDKPRLQTLAAAHARFLSGSYQTLEGFMNTVKSRVKAMGKAAGGPANLDPDFAQRVAEAVAADTFALVAQVTRLDRQLAEHIGQLADCKEDALTDPLTGLLNRRGLDSFGGQLLAQAGKSRLGAACLVIDLDDFKQVNDRFGHAAGDALLKAAAELIRSNVAAGDLVARLGGDEYAVLVAGPTQGDAHAMAQRIHAVCNGRRITVGPGQQATLKMSIGGVYLDSVTSATTPDALLDAADKVMYRCKQGGKSGLKFEAIKKRAA